jgi:hypothetical protein
MGGYLGRVTPCLSAASLVFLRPLCLGMWYRLRIAGVDPEIKPKDIIIADHNCDVHRMAHDGVWALSPAEKATVAEAGPHMLALGRGPLPLTLSPFAPILTLVRVLLFVPYMKLGPF